MFALQRGSIQLSHSRILFYRSNSSSSPSKTTSLSPTECIVTNTHNIPKSSQNTEKTMHSQFKNALQNIPTRILSQLLKKNRIRVSSAHNHSDRNCTHTPPKKLLLSKLYRITKKNIKLSNPNLNNSKKSAKASEQTQHSKSRLEINNFVKFSSELVRKTCLKLRDLNSYYNANYDIITDTHSFTQTLSLLIKEINVLNSNIYELSTSNLNPSFDDQTIKQTQLNCEEFKRDFLYELLSLHADDSKIEDDMLQLCQIFFKFMKFPRFTMFDHIQYIGHLCHINSILSGFLHSQSVHPSRLRNSGHFNDESDTYYDEEYDSDEEFADETDIKVMDSKGNSVPFTVQSIKPIHKTPKPKTNVSEKMSENTNEIYMNRLRNIYKMDLSQYGVFGMDENVKSLLKRALLSRGLHPSFISNTNAKNGNKSSELQCENVSIEHNKGILLYGAPGTGKTLLAKALKYLLLVKDENVSIVNGPEIEDIYIGQTEKNIRNLFEKASNDYAKYGMDSPLHIIIFDEIDSIAKKRDSSANSKVSDKAVQQLLSCLDGANSLNNVLTIGTTNRYGDIDNALLRPGRFGVHLYISLPDCEQRRDLLLHCFGDSILSNDFELQWLVDMTDGLAHSDICALISQSKINAIERIIQEWFDTNGESAQSDLYEKIRKDFQITSRDIVCALDEIRINQVGRDRNNRHLNDSFAYDIVF